MFVKKDLKINDPSSAAILSSFTPFRIFGHQFKFCLNKDAPFGGNSKIELFKRNGYFEIKRNNNENDKAN
jgi:hypothetical protein